MRNLALVSLLRAGALNLLDPTTQTHKLLNPERRRLIRFSVQWDHVFAHRANVCVGAFLIL
jgi:hypothetical protein